MKSITFVYLPHPWLKKPDAQLPLGILYLAAITRGAGHETHVANCSGEPSIIEAVNSLPKTDVYGITATSLEIPMANLFGQALRARFPRAKLMIGGPGTCTPEYINKVYDVVFVGEAEEHILGILEDFPSAPLWQYSSRVCDLQKLPYPARDLIHGKLGGEIFAYGAQYAGNESTTILSSRGCPYRCSFCATPSTTIRFRDPVSVVGEMFYLYRKFGIRQFRFSDDAFTLQRERVMLFCDIVQNVFEGIDIAWRVSCRVKPIDEKMIQTMVEAGCKEFSLGIESFDDDVLCHLNKKASVQDNINALEVIHQAGGKARILFMIRTPGQTYQTVYKNIEVLEKVPYEIIACTSFVPLPGSDIWSNPKRYGIEILSRDLEDYNFYFYGAHGRNQLKRLFRYLDRDTEVIESQSEYFRHYLEQSGKLNQG